jgi:hypothetical protein
MHNARALLWALCALVLPRAAWSRGDRVPSGRPVIAQSVGHVNITMSEKMNRGRTN